MLSESTLAQLAYEGKSEVFRAYRPAVRAVWPKVSDAYVSPKSRTSARLFLFCSDAVSAMLEQIGKYRWKVGATGP